MGGAGTWAALVVAVCVMCGESEASAAAVRQAYYENELASNDYLKVGRSFNLLTRFGFLTLSIKVSCDVLSHTHTHTYIHTYTRTHTSPLHLPHHSTFQVFPVRDNNSWLFRERTVEVFQKNSYWAIQSNGQPSEPTSTKSPRRVFDPHFVIDFCDNAHDLLTSYFDNFYIEGVPEPHRVFTSSISTKTTAQHLGIHPTYLSSIYSFVLVRLIRRNRRATLDGG